MNHNRILYSVNEASRLLNISRSRFYEEWNRGALAIVKNGARTFVHADEIDAYIARLQIGRRDGQA